MSEPNPYQPPRQSAESVKRPFQLSAYAHDRLALVLTALVTFLIVWTITIACMFVAR